LRGREGREGGKDGRLGHVLLKWWEGGREEGEEERDK